VQRNRRRDAWTACMGHRPPAQLAVATKLGGRFHTSCVCGQFPGSGRHASPSILAPSNRTVGRLTGPLQTPPPRTGRGRAATIDSGRVAAPFLMRRTMRCCGCGGGGDGSGQRRGDPRDASRSRSRRSRSPPNKTHSGTVRLVRRCERTPAPMTPSPQRKNLDSQDVGNPNGANKKEKLLATSC